MEFVTILMVKYAKEQQDMKIQVKEMHKSKRSNLSRMLFIQITIVLIRQNKEDL